jgi:hypothetical protein
MMRRVAIVVGVAWLVVVGYALVQVYRDDWAQTPEHDLRGLGAGNGDVRWH